MEEYLLHKIPHKIPDLFVHFLSYGMNLLSFPRPRSSKATLTNLALFRYMFTSQVVFSVKYRTFHPAAHTGFPDDSDGMTHISCTTSVSWGLWDRLLYQPANCWASGFSTICLGRGRHSSLSTHMGRRKENSIRKLPKKQPKLGRQVVQDFCKAVMKKHL